MGQINNTKYRLMRQRRSATSLMGLHNSLGLFFIFSGFHLLS